ncbi:NADP-dependent oxidoreductase [Kineococcus sp. SYSU DK002]|uniref:NADP-dependent oxidoreductase n=1 Tax=Kineococcus sp. SYSU DK002 TaxID=3383123 RepID=UPI003D7E4948
MSRVVRFERWGGPDVLRVVEVPARHPGPGEVAVTVRAAGVTAGESAAREGALAQLYPMAFPAATGSEFAGVVTAAGEGAGRFAVGDEVLGWSPDHGGHADVVVVPERSLVAKPAAVSWEVAGALYVAGVTAWTCVETTRVRDGDVVLVVGAASDAGTLVVQLARLCGATVVGAADPVHHEWLHAHGAVPVACGDAGSLARAVHAAAGAVDVLVDTTGADVGHLAEALGVAEDRCVATLPLEADLEFGDPAPRRGEVLAELVDLVATDRLHVPIAGSFALSDVVEAFVTAERPHRQGRIVLLP